MSVPDFGHMPAGYNLLYRETLDSTNEEALRLGQAGEEGPLWVVARRQTAGRGRRGRAWTSPEGNLMTSLLLSLSVTPIVAAQLSFVAGLAVYDMIVELSRGKKNVGLKWPNDVLLADKKIAGILLEASGTANKRMRLIIGIGINLVHYPKDTPYPAASVAAFTGEIHSISQVLPLLAHKFSVRFQEWIYGEGFETTRLAWLERAAGVGEKIEVRLPSTIHKGIFAGLDEQGALMLAQGRGRVCSIPAGDVFFPTPLKRDAL
ncbi:MAG: biotin--[acetyl-CoA-carboxylase] ligase [Parvularculales bacterium]